MLAAMASAALIFISSVITLMRCCEIARKMPGKTKELFIWF